MNKIIKWIKNFLYQDIVIVENNKNSKITINGKVVFDDTKDK
jgi:predicted transcriptional regulator